MEFRIQELRQMLAMIEDALQERPGVLLLHEDRARLQSNHDKVKLWIAQLEQANKEKSMNTPALKWFRFSQNNSGGYFLVNEEVAEDVYVQAENAEHAADRAAVIFAPYSEFCECCGERWPTTAWEGGFDVPTKYGEALDEIVADHFHKQARLHHLDGNVETVFYKLTKEHDDGI